MRKPTYSPAEIRQMCQSIDVESYKTLIEILDEEIDLYNDEELKELMNVSMIIFTRTLLRGSIKNLDK
jgi:hypothetical protein